MTTREILHKMVDLLPESEWEAVYRALEERLAKHDPVLRAFLNAPEDDEPESEEERAEVEEAYEDLKAGECSPGMRSSENLICDLGDRAYRSGPPGPARSAS